MAKPAPAKPAPPKPRSRKPRSRKRDLATDESAQSVNPYDFDSWFVASPDDPEHREAEVTQPFDLLDHRDDVEPGPEPSGPGSAKLWGLRVVRNRVRITPLGVVYPSTAGVVLAQSPPASSQLAWLSASTVFGPVNNPAQCPTYALTSGSGDYSTTAYRSRKAARIAGDALADSRATTDAGLVRNGYTCPNPACQNKQVIGLRERHSRTTHVSIVGSMGWGEWRYYAEGTYWWTALIRCS